MRVAVKLVLLLIAIITAIGMAHLSLADDSVSSSKLPPLPANLRIGDNVGKPVVPLELAAVGPPLIVSNAPERLVNVPKAAAMYRTAMDQERFRVFYHHQNGTSAPLKIGIAVTNPSRTESVELFLEQNSQCLPRENRSTVSLYPAAAGKAALRNWFESMRMDQSLGTLKPGETRYIMQNVDPQMTVTGMYDFALKSQNKPRVIVTVLACRSLPADPTVIAVLPPGGKGVWYRRGMFPHCDRYGRVTFDASIVSCLDMAGPLEGKYCRLMQNEMEKAIDDPKGLNPGNYGVVYNLVISIRNPSQVKLKTHCLMSAAGGAGYSQITLDGKYKEYPRMLPAYGSWIFKDMLIDKDTCDGFVMEFSLPGGCSGAHRLCIWPENCK